MKRILITGGAGFIGSNLSEKLVKTGKYEVHILDIKQNPVNLKDFYDEVNYIQGDVRDEVLLRKLFNDISFDGVIHLAAVSRVVWGEKYPNLSISTNVGGTETILSSISN